MRKGTEKHLVSQAKHYSKVLIALGPETTWSRLLTDADSTRHSVYCRCDTCRGNDQSFNHLPERDRVWLKSLTKYINNVDVPESWEQDLHGVIERGRVALATQLMERG